MIKTIVIVMALFLSVIWLANQFKASSEYLADSVKTSVSDVLNPTKMLGR